MWLTVKVWELGSTAASRFGRGWSAVVAMMANCINQPLRNNAWMSKEENQQGLGHNHVE
jgi:hypothetical protein